MQGMFLQPIYLTQIYSILTMQSGNVYKICAQRDLPHVDLDHHMGKWLEFLTARCYGRPLQPDDCVFPAIGANGVLLPDEHLSPDRAQALISKYTEAAGIKLLANSFSTHCFRRGGAQYRFMLAPLGKRWTLNTVRWWGGWAVGENVSIKRKCFGYAKLKNRVARYTSSILVG